MVVGDLDGENAEAVAAEVRGAGGRALGVQFDIADDDSVARAGGRRGRRSSVASTTCTPTPPTCRPRPSAATPTRSTVPLEVFDHTLQVNLRGHLLCTRHVLPHLLERGRWRVRLHQLGGRAHRRAATAVVRACRRPASTRWCATSRRAGAGRGSGRTRSAPGLVLTPTMAETIAPEFTVYALRGRAVPAARSARRHRGDGRLPDVRRRRVGQRPGAERRRGRQPAPELVARP